MTSLGSFWLSHCASQIEYDPNSGCWLWSGGVDLKGYGRRHIPCVPPLTYLATHRASYSYHYDTDLTPSDHIRHTCDTPPCCNPEHLLLGTAKENADDRERRGRSNAKISKTDAAVIFLDRTSSQREMAARFGVSQTLVSCIRSGKNRSYLKEMFG
jgi:hypothetical protein